MTDTFYVKLSKSSAHRPSRESICNLVLENPNLLPELMAVALDLRDKQHHKALWALELLAETHIDWLQPFLDGFCKTLPNYRNESAIRPAAKICMLAAAEHLQKKKEKGFLSETQIRQIAEACLDWLIGNCKVAPKAYGMRALFHLGKAKPWIHQQLRPILEKDFASQSPAYKAAAREILKRT